MVDNVMPSGKIEKHDEEKVLDLQATLGRVAKCRGQENFPIP